MPSDAPTAYRTGSSTSHSPPEPVPGGSSAQSGRLSRWEISDSHRLSLVLKVTAEPKDFQTVFPHSHCASAGVACLSLYDLNLRHKDPNVG